MASYKHLHTLALLIKCILTLFFFFLLGSYKFVVTEKIYKNNGGSVAQAKRNSYMRKQWEVGKNNMKKKEVYWIHAKKRPPYVCGIYLC